MSLEVYLHHFDQKRIKTDVSRQRRSEMQTDF